jgi:uncharacterized protein (DUF1778 family)
MLGKGRFTRAGQTVPVSAPKKTAQKIERLEARVSSDMKALCQKAATIQGRSLTDFVVNSAVEAATRIVRENEFVELSRRDRMAFVEALLDPPAPNARLRKAMRRHNRMVADQ